MQPYDHRAQPCVVDAPTPGTREAVLGVKADKQTAGDKLYRPMAGNLKTSMAYQAALGLVFKGEVNRVATPYRCCMRGA